MTPDQVKAARVLLGWSMAKLGIRSGTTTNMVKTFERTGRVTPLRGQGEGFDAVAAVRATLEEAGVEFTDGAASGLRLRQGSA